MDTNKEPIVVIVDDSITIRTMLRRVLQQMGFVIYEADSGEAALKLLETIEPDAILMDVEMPGMGGFVACEKVRALPKNNFVPIMMITSLEDLESINRAYQAGATDFSTKPLNWDIIGHRVRYMIRTSHDFIELQKTKRDLNQLNLDLEERVIRRTEQLKSVNQNLKEMLDELQATQSQLIEAEKLASLGALVAGVAHEVNTPIGIAITTISMLSEDLGKLEKLYSQNLVKRSDLSGYLSGTKEEISLAEMNLHRAAELIKSFKQVSTDQLSEKRRNFNLKEYLEEIVMSLKPALNQTKLTTKINCPDDLVIDSYPGTLFQIMTIFIMNSIVHAYEPGEEGVLSVDITPLRGEIEIAYSDTGRGIPPENLKKIFDPFFTTRRASKSTGLGLNIALNSVTKLLGGTLKCTSVSGKGATFTITMPKEFHPRTDSKSKTLNIA